MPYRSAVYRAPGYVPRERTKYLHDMQVRKNLVGIEDLCRKFYSTRGWRRFRMWFLKKNPLCIHCMKLNFRVPATDVDHEPPLREQLSRGMSGVNEDMVQSLCHSCHSRKTARARVVAVL